MDYTDIIQNRFSYENEGYKTSNVLVCFSHLPIGLKLNKLASTLTSKSEKKSVTLLYFINEAEEVDHRDDMDEFRHNILSRFSTDEEEKITLRLFIQHTDDYADNINRMIDKQQCDFLLLGITENDLPPLSATSQLADEIQTEAQKQLETIGNRIAITSALFIDHGNNTFRKIFVPVLHKNDLFLIIFLYRIVMQDSNTEILIWDAIGMIQSDPKIQKAYQSIVKKADGRLSLWNNDKKIDSELISQQDLMITGIEGWNKLISTPLQWISSLPSILIIRDKIK